MIGRNKINILIVTAIFPPDIGGPSSYVTALSEHLTRKGHKVHVITMSDSENLYDSPVGFFAVTRISRKRTLLLRVISIVMSIVSNGRQADIIYVNGLAFESALSRFFIKTPMVMKVVGDLIWERAVLNRTTQSEFDSFEKSNSGLKIYLQKKLRRWWTQRMDAIITPSLYLANHVKKWGIKTSNIYTINNAAPDVVTHDYPTITSRFVTVGRLVPWKHIDEIVLAMDQLKDFELQIIGDGPMENEIQSQIHRLKLENRVKLLGRLSRIDTLNEISKAQALILFSTYEGLPHVVLEAMGVKTPVIASDSGGTSELVINGETGLLINPHNVTGLCNAMREIHNNKELNKKIVSNGVELVKKLSENNMIKTTENFLLKNIRQNQGNLEK